jgi:hypothetical protein
MGGAAPDDQFHPLLFAVRDRDDAGAVVYALTGGERPQPISAGTAASMDTYCR